MASEKRERTGGERTRGTGRRGLAERVARRAERLRAKSESSGQRAILPEGLLAELRRLVALPAGRQLTMMRSSRKLPTPTAVHQLLDASAETRSSSPVSTYSTAALALAAASELDPERWPEPLPSDLAARAAAEAGNALRILGDFDGAEELLAQARSLAGRGSGDPGLAATIGSFLGSLYRHQHRFEEARRELDAVLGLHAERGDAHLMGRTLVSIGIVWGAELESRRAVLCFTRALHFLDRPRDPVLYTKALHNLAWHCLEVGLAREARATRQVLEQLRGPALGGHNTLRLAWLDARLLAASGDEEGAAVAFRHLCRDMADRGMDYERALASFDLAALLVRQGRQDELADLVAEVAGVLERLGIDATALGATILAREAAAGRASEALVERAALALRRSRLRIVGI